MKSMAAFDSFNCALDSVNLVEAAAGTGKTYNIQNLVARLVLERGLPIDAIAVVTYTEAAAGELKTRIRRVMTEIRQFADSPSAAQASARESRLWLNAVRRTAESEQLAPDEALRLCRRRLTLALLDFDRAAISTIHGFCRKVLSENAFESGGGFSPELITDADDRLQNFINDWLRQQYYRTDCPRNRHCLLTINQLAFTDLIREKLAKPDLEICFDGQPAPSAPQEQLESEVFSALEELRGLIRPGMFDSYSNDLTGDYGRYRENRLSKLDCNYLPPLLLFRQNGNITPELIALLRTLRLDRIQDAAAKKNASATAERLAGDPFIQAATRFNTALESFNHRVAVDAAAEITAAFNAFKHRQNQFSFDDLLLQTDAALERRPEFVAALRRKYPAGIIDEFQDTDPVQYRIFHRIFAHGSGIFFMVGDPKQAIYSFRGGDLFTYFEARSSTPPERRYTLTVNYRSSPAQIAAVNAVFGGLDNPFKLEELQLPEVSAPSGDGATPDFAYDRLPPPPPLELCVAENESEEDRCATEIFRLLTDPAFKLPDSGQFRNCTPGDIAVLAKSWTLAEKIRARLAELEIPSAIYQAENVFHTSTAKNLFTLLKAVVHPGNRQCAADALTSELGIMTVEQMIVDTAANRGTFDVARRQLAGLAEIWRGGSFAAMFRNLMTEFNIPLRLARVRGGERTLADLMQLGDLLHVESVGRNLTPEALLRFFQRQIDSDGTPSDAHRQALETDRSAVRIMTIHASKGLEFPVTVVAGLSGKAVVPRRGRSLETSLRSFHRNGRLCIDLARGSLVPEVNAEAEQEMLRLAYVAFTRAVYKTVVIATANPAPDSPLAYLFDSGDRSRLAEFSSRVTVRPPASGETWNPFNSESSSRRLRAADFPGRITNCRQFASFSMLTMTDDSAPGHRPGIAVEVIDDEPALREPDADTPSPRLAGTRFGTAIHAVFEKLDFAARKAEIEAATIAELEPLAPTPEELAYTVKIITATLGMPLFTPDGDRFTLRDIPPRDRVSELKFHYQFQHGFQSAALFETVNRHLKAPLAGQWSDRDITGGFMTGAIDLVFRYRERYYIVDWKTNFLGHRAADYAPEALDRVMSESLYTLQYLIYIVALEKYLAARCPGTGGADWYRQHFGGAAYLFVRGGAFTPAAGICTVRPDYSLIADLKEVIG